MAAGGGGDGGGEEDAVGESGKSGRSDESETEGRAAERRPRMAGGREGSVGGGDGGGLARVSGLMEVMAWAVRGMGTMGNGKRWWGNL